MKNATRRPSDAKLSPRTGPGSVVIAGVGANVISLLASIVTVRVLGVERRGDAAAFGGTAFFFQVLVGGGVMPAMLRAPVSVPGSVWWRPITTTAAMAGAAASAAAWLWIPNGEKAGVVIAIGVTTTVGVVASSARSRIVARGDDATHRNAFGIESLFRIAIVPLVVVIDPEWPLLAVVIVGASVVVVPAIALALAIAVSRGATARRGTECGTANIPEPGDRDIRLATIFRSSPITWWKELFGRSFAGPLSLVLSSRSLGLFAVAMSVVEAIVLAPRLLQPFVLSSRLRLATSLTSISSVLIGLTAIAIAVASAFAIPIVYGSEFADARWHVGPLALAFWIYGGGLLGISALDSNKRDSASWLSLLALSTLLTVALVLGFFFDLTGVTIAFVAVSLMIRGAVVALARQQSKRSTIGRAAGSGST